MSETTTSSADQVGTDDLPMFIDTTVQIMCQEGPRDVPALTHPYCPGMAVVMPVFGFYNVTHIASGFKMGGKYERAGAAAQEMAEWAAIARARGFSWADATGETAGAMLAACHEDRVPFGGAFEHAPEGKQPMTVLDWVRCVRSHEEGDDFPWEDSEDDPWLKAEDLIRTLAPA